MVEFHLINLIGIAISLALFYQSLRLVRKRKESVLEFLMWTSFGVILFVLSFGNVVTVLDITNFFGNILGFLGFNSGRIGLLVLANLGLLMLLFYTYINTKTNRQMIYDLNQQLSLYESEKEDR